jgi:alpha-ribazole phosphatase
MEIYIIRHTSVAAGTQFCYGQSDVPLADSFAEEVAKFKQELPTDFDAIYCSTLDRCKQLATALQLQDVSYETQLQEMNFGDWEGVEWAKINQEILNTWMQDFVNINTPNGENLQELYNRVQLFFDELRHQNHKKVLIITHAGVIRCVWSYLLEVPLKNVFKIPVKHGEFFVCKITENKDYDSIVKFGNVII